MKKNNSYDHDSPFSPENIEQYLSDLHVHYALATEIGAQAERLVIATKNIHQIIQKALTNAQKLGCLQNKPLASLQELIHSLLTEQQNIASSPEAPLYKNLEHIAAKLSMLAINTAIIAEKNSAQSDGIKTIAKEMQSIADQTTAATQELSNPTQGNTKSTSEAIQTSISAIINDHQEQARFTEEHIALLMQAHEELEKIIALTAAMLTICATLKQHKDQWNNLIEHNNKGNNGDAE